MHALLLVALTAAATPKVVSPEWTATDVKKELVSFYSQSMATALRQQGLEVITAQEIATMLGMERQKALVGCNTEGVSCMAELANALGADAILMVNVAHFSDGSFRGLATLISSASGKTLSTAKLDSPNEKKLLEAIEDAAPLLAAPWGATVKKSGRPEALKYWWVPGALGVAVSGAAVGCIVGSRLDAEAIKKPETPYAVAQRGQALQTAGFVGVGVGAGLLATSIIMAVWPEAPVQSSVTVTSSGATVGVGGSF
jgi:hypothetical protein